MIPQRRLREGLRFLSDFQTLFDVTQQMASAQLQRLQMQAALRTGVVDVLQRDFLPMLPATCRRHPLVRGGHAGTLRILITFDEGLVGPLQTALLREALAGAGAGTEWLLVGQRGARLLGPRVGSAPVVPIPADGVADEQMRRVARHALARFRAASLREVQLIAPRFLSTMRQDVVAQRLLPLAMAEAQPPADARELLMEPSAERVLEEVARLWVEAACLEAFWSARCAEVAARALHVVASREEVTKQKAGLRHTLCKVLHGRLDEEVRQTCVVQRRVARRMTEESP